MSAQIFPQTSMRLIFHHGSLSGIQNNYGSWRRWIRLLKKEVSNYQRESLICTHGIKDTVHDYIIFNGTFCIACQCFSTKFRKVPHTAEQSQLVGFFTVSGFSFYSQKQIFFFYSLQVLHNFFSLSVWRVCQLQHIMQQMMTRTSFPRKQTNIKLTGL